MIKEFKKEYQQDQADVTRQECKEEIFYCSSISNLLEHEVLV